MDAAALTCPAWWIARHWLRFLTGLAIIAVALGPARVEPAVTVPPTPALAAEAVPVAGVEPQRPAVAPGEERSIVEPDPIVVAQAPTRVRQQRPAPVALPVSMHVSPFGQRAPPASAGVDVAV